MYCDPLLLASPVIRMQPEGIWELTNLDSPVEYFRVYTDEGLICRSQVRSSWIKLPQRP